VDVDPESYPSLLTGLVWSPIGAILDIQTVTAPAILIFLVFVSIQWLFIGAMVNIVVTRLRQPSPSAPDQ
jgi:hypothetical protein